MEVASARSPWVGGRTCRLQMRACMRARERLRAKDEKLLQVEGTRGPYKLTPRGRKRIRSTSHD
jgi:hypothetical protein